MNEDSFIFAFPVYIFLDRATLQFVGVGGDELAGVLIFSDREVAEEYQEVKGGDVATHLIEPIPEEEFVGLLRVLRRSGAKTLLFDRNPKVGHATVIEIRDALARLEAGNDEHPD